ncbi:MAG: polysaccharide pyruvyl transferase family protein [Clostridia bacterium]
MKNILIINQPLNNRGDEAAHRSFILTLAKDHPDANFEVLFSNANDDSINQFKVDCQNVKYTNFKNYSKGSYRIKKWALRLNMLRLSLFYPSHYSFSRKIKKSDFVICAPGGICMGPFQDWQHIYWLTIAKLYRKKTAYYSRSFGPFKETNKWDRVFKRVSINLLNYFQFISIRDSKSQILGDKLKIKYVPSIDSAFLTTPQTNIPTKIKKQIGDDKFAVFVPNELTWHPTFKKTNPEYLENFYLKIINSIAETCNIKTIVMLPQLFNSPINDQRYFEKLKKKTKQKIVVVEDKYSSNIQQSIISKSEIVIGGRYHSIVFAINNKKPFVALSYEHKVEGLLYLIKLEKHMYNIENLAQNEKDLNNEIKIINQLLQDAKESPKAKYEAKKIAKNCMSIFNKDFLKL